MNMNLTRWFQVAAFGWFMLLPVLGIENSIHAQLPADVTINHDAGRGNFLFVTPQLENGEDLPLVVDTGAPGTLLDKSLEPKLGKRLGTRTIWMLGGKQKVAIYSAPNLYLGGVPLMTGGNIITCDLKKYSSRAGRPVMGFLGMDCLEHYCIQLDFEARKMRFLDPDHAKTTGLGKAFPVTFASDDKAELIAPWIPQPGLLGGTSSNSVIDTGCNIDGLTEKAAMKSHESGGCWTRLKHFMIENGVVKGKAVALPECVWDGNIYSNITIGKAPSDSPSWIGLRFLARHLVTLNFPKGVIYLKRTSIGPLIKENTNATEKL